MLYTIRSMRKSNPDSPPWIAFLFLVAHSHFLHILKWFHKNEIKHIFSPHHLHFTEHMQKPPLYGTQRRY